MFHLIDRPVFFPGRTLFGDTQGPVVDTSVELPVGGHVYLSVVEAIHVGKAVEMVEGPVHEAAVGALTAEIVERDARIVELEAKVAQGVQVIPVTALEDFVSAALAAKAEPEVARKGRRAA